MNVIVVVLKVKAYNYVGCMLATMLLLQHNVYIIV